MATLLGQRYRLGDPIGTGGSARVYRAHDERLDRTVAVKVLDEEAANTADPALRRRFESEARTAAQFVHPNAVTIFDAGADSGSLYLVMELVTGGSLAQRLADSGPMAPEQVAVLGRQVASALAAAHAAGIIHRDVKPANVLLDDGDNAKLADFGIARRFDEIADAMTSAGMVVGTRHYVSPEQAYGQPLGPATDVFSLGVTLYEAATGTRPPDATERATDHRLDPRALVPSIGAGLAAAIGRSTALAVDDRYASAGEFADALDACVTEPVGAAMPGGGTAIMPEHLLPGAGAAAISDAANTAVADMQSGSTMPVGATTPMTTPAPLPRTPDGPLRLGGELADERDQRRKQWRVAVLIIVVALALGGFFLAFADDDGSDAGTDVAATSALAANSPPVTIPPDTMPTTTVPPTLAPTTLPPTTLAPTTLAPTTLPPPIEIIPGFPIPVDVEQFLATLEPNPDLVGERGEELAKELDKVLDERPNRIAERAAELQARIDDWVRDEEIDPAIAGAAIVFLDQVIAANPAPGGGPGSDDDD